MRLDRRIFTVFSFACLLFVVSLTNAADWPRWRGPNGDGLSEEKNLLKEWPSGGPPLAWRIQGIGKGMSSISIKGDSIYTLGELEGGCQMICLNKADGSLKWKTKFGGGDPNCTPTVDDTMVYALSRDGKIAAFECATGKKVWSHDFVSDFGGQVPQWGYSESPLVDGDLLICTPGSRQNFVVALNKKTGVKKWSSQLPDGLKLKGHGGAGYASPVISNAGGVKQYITLTGYGVVSVDAKNGNLLWGYDKIANGTANIPTPIINKEYVLCSSGYGDGGTALLKIVKKGAKFNPEEIYYKKANELQNHHGGMILIGDDVYMGHGHNNGFPVCFDFMTGKESWKPGRGPGGGSAAMAYADGNLYFRYEDAKMALIEANPDTYNVKGSFDIASQNGKSWPHPVICDGLLYLRDQHELLVYNIKK